MKKEALVVIILLCLAVGIFSVAPNVSAEEEEFVATVIDTAGSETTVYDLYLYYYKVSGIFYESESAKSMRVRKGESVLTIPFANIREMEFEWAETEEEKSNVTITVLSGEKIKGEPLRVSHWSFKGKTDFGDFRLSVGKTKKVMFSHAITPSSPTPTPVTTTPTPTLAPTPSPTPTASPFPVPSLTPASRPDEIKPPCEKGYKVVTHPGATVKQTYTKIATTVETVVTNVQRAISACWAHV